MMPVFAIVAASVLLALSPASPGRAEDPFTGTWTLNPAKSHFTGARDEIAPDGPNAWKVKYGILSWTVKADGKDTPTPYGGTMALEVKSPTVWQVTDKVKGRVTDVSTWTLSADGKTMTRVIAGTKAGGQHFSDTSIVKRIGNGTGFAGTWESVTVKVSAPASMTLHVTDSSFEQEVPAEKFSFKCAFDGKPHAVSGPNTPEHATVICARKDARTITFDSRYEGKSLSKSAYAVSPGGKTLISTSRDAGTNVTSTAVFDRR